MKVSDITYRTIQTGLENTPVNDSIMSSVLSQMSDGYWEESSYMRGYWKCADVYGRDSGIELDIYPQLEAFFILRTFLRRQYGNVLILSV